MPELFYDLGLDIGENLGRKSIAFCPNQDTSRLRAQAGKEK